MADLSRRQCNRCRLNSLACRVNEQSDRCHECVRTGAECNLAPLYVPKWKRLHERREQLERERDEALARMVRVSAEIASIKEKQDKMVNQELENIAVQEKEEEAEASSRAVTEPSLLNGGGDFSELGEVDWNSLAADFGLETQPVSQDN